jgi:lysophospholipase L1-like esterase
MTIAAGSRYVAMGSSAAAGPGIPHQVPGSPRQAGRSTGNYAHRVSRALRLDLQDVSFSGATTADLLWPSAYYGQPAQLDAVTPATRLVTLSVGGNDVGYVPRLVAASVPWPLRALPRFAKPVAAFGDPGATEERFAQLAANLAAIARRVRQQAPGCRVIAVDYLTILPPEGTRCSGPPPADVVAWGRAVAARLATVTREAARAAGWDYIAASAASADHHAWSAEPWTQRFYPALRHGAPYHPNAAGMTAVADLIRAALAGQPASAPAWGGAERRADPGLHTEGTARRSAR